MGFTPPSSQSTFNSHHDPEAANVFLLSVHILQMRTLKHNEGTIRKPGLHRWDFATLGIRLDFQVQGLLDLPSHPTPPHPRECSALHLLEGSGNAASAVGV